MGKLSAALLLSIILLLVESGIFCLDINSSFGCIGAERKALLKFKASLIDPSNTLSTWKDIINCCTWKGVSCDKITGHIIMLDLSYNMLHSKSLDSSLLELKHLNYLDLSFNNFESSSIPAFLGSMKQLQHLNLSHTLFDGFLPYNLGNLSNLRVLDLGDAMHLPMHDLNWVRNLSSLEHLNLNGGDLSQIKDLVKVLNTLPFLDTLHLSRCSLNNSHLPQAGFLPYNLGNLSNLRILDLSDAIYLPMNDLNWVHNLSSLEHLNLNGVDLSQTKDLVKVLNTLPLLDTLHLSRGLLNNSHLPQACVNSTFFSHVRYLDMSSNSFEGEFPCFVLNMTLLRFLDLANNGKISSSSPLPGLRNLVHLDLSGNPLQHNATWISELLRNKCSLKSLNLKNTIFYGNMSEAFKDLSGCWSRNLETLNLGENQFSVHIPEELGEIKRLVHLDLRMSNFSGQIPTSLGKLSNLEELDLYGNKLFGVIPFSLGNLRSLRVLDLGSNNLSGEIPVSMGELSHLERIDISYNSFNTTLSEAHFAKLSNLKYVDASYSNSIKFKVSYDWVPAFQLNALIMTSLNIGGSFPSWLQTQKAMQWLDLSNCSISGTLPKWLGGINLEQLFLSKNHIYGTIPELSPSMEFLDLSDNMINHLPTNIGQRVPLLNYLCLARNIINGSLPDSLCKMKALVILDLSNNYLSGNVLECWQNFQNLKVLGLSSNGLSGIIPKSIGAAHSLEWVKFYNNNLVGEVPSTLKNCTKLQILDVGENELSGKIPDWIGNLHDMKILILRNNQFHGMIPQTLCQASKLRIVDLGNNKLTGYIPHCLGNLSALGEGGMLFYMGTVERSNVISQVLRGAEREYTRAFAWEHIVNLDLSSNNLIGEIPTELMALSNICGPNLSNFCGLNLSHNQLGGEISEKIGGLTKLLSLDLSHNHLEGNIPERIGELQYLESLDLSNNNLFGRIPKSLSNLTFLSYLNLSNNNLSGKIPTGRQLQTLENLTSIYDGNPQLCGTPLLKRCPGDEARKGPNDENHGEAGEDRIDKICFYAFVTSGFAMGFWGFIGFLVFKRSWRQSYFGFVEVVITKVLRR